MLILLILLAIGFIIFTTVRLRLHPFLSLLVTAILFGLLAGMPAPQVIKTVNEGFGATLGSIGIVIVLGTMIGAFLEHSGGALVLANRILSLIGDRGVPLALSLVGYVVSIPVFCDSGFVILHSLSKALAYKARLSLAVTSIALGFGLMASHTMLPPTPGPIAAAGILNADLGLVILAGVLPSLAGMLAGWFFATRVASRVHIAATEPEMAAPSSPTPSLPAPSFGASLLPIFLPILLIVGKSVAGLPSRPLGEGGAYQVLLFIGEPVVSLLIGLGFAFLLPRKFDLAHWSANGWVGTALVDAAGIILITGAGGAFGKVLQASGIADLLGSALAGAQLGLWLPFLLSAAIKSAQGSSTVAIITSASLVAPMAEGLGLASDWHLALIVVMVGAGSTIVSHANDSFFWVVTQMTGLNIRQGYALQSGGSLVVGLAAGLVAWGMS